MNDAIHGQAIFSVRPLLAAALLSCVGCAPKLPAQSVLQETCNVWWDNGQGRGIYAAVAGESSVLHGTSSADGPSMEAGGEITMNGHTFAHFDGEQLAIDQMTMLATSYTGSIPERPASYVALESSGNGDTHVFNVSEQCMREETALGTASVFLALFEARRAAMASSMAKLGGGAQPSTYRPAPGTPGSPFGH